jgi:hypothetical protein
VGVELSYMLIPKPPTLRNHLKTQNVNGRQPNVCSVSALTEGIFTVAGLDAVFEFANDKRDASSAAIQHAK